ASLLRNCDREIWQQGGAHEAVGDLLERLPGRLLSFAELARAFAGHVTEGTPKRAQAAPTCLERHFGDVQIRVAQQRLGPLDVAREQVTVRGQPEGVPERTREMRLGNPAHAREPPHWPLL